MVKKPETKNEAKEAAKIEYDVKVLKAKDFSKNGKTIISCDLEVNGIKIYGCFYREGQKDGHDWALVDLPKTKGKDDKYYSIVWFPMSKELVTKIADQISFALENN